MRGRADPACYSRNRSLGTKRKLNGSSIRIRCIFRHSQGTEAQKPPGRRRAFMPSQPDVAPASTLATTLPVINRVHRAPESTEGLSRPA